MLVTVNPQPAPADRLRMRPGRRPASSRWPSGQAGAWRRGALVPWGLRPAVFAGVVAVLVVLVAWFGLEVVTGAGHAGLAERVLGLAQAAWPLTVALSCRHPAGAPVGHAPSAA